MNYVVKAGDTLSKLAAKYLGDPSYYTKIMAVNPQILTPNLIKIGQTIKIPVSGTTPAKFDVKNYFEKLKDPKVATAVVLLGLGAIYLNTKKYKTA